MNPQKPKQVTTHRIEVDRMSYAELQEQLGAIMANQQRILDLLAGDEEGTVYLDQECLLTTEEFRRRLKVSRATVSRRRSRGIQMDDGRKQYRYDWCTISKGLLTT